MLRPVSRMGQIMTALLAFCTLLTGTESLCKRPRHPLHVCSGLLVVALCLGVATLAVADDRPRAKVGTIFLQDPVSSAPWHGAFVQGLRDLGCIEGSNLTLLARYAGGNAQ